MKIATRPPTDEQIRDYDAFAERVRSLRARGWDVREQGEICGLPLFAAEWPSSDNASIPQVLVVGGIHGNEPAGVEAAVSWMESGRAERWPVHWLVLPCANPCGWLHDRRIASSKRDLNRSFHLASVALKLNLSITRWPGDGSCSRWIITRTPMRRDTTSARSRRERPLRAKR